MECIKHYISGYKSCLDNKKNCKELCRIMIFRKKYKLQFNKELHTTNAPT